MAKASKELLHTRVASLAAKVDSLVDYIDRDMAVDQRPSEKKEEILSTASNLLASARISLVVASAYLKGVKI